MSIKLVPSAEEGASAAAESVRPVQDPSTEQPSAAPYSEHEELEQAASTALAHARIDASKIFDEYLEHRWRTIGAVTHADPYSIRALGEKYLGVTERTIRKWRQGDKPIPLAALLVLPIPFAKELVERLLASRVGGRGARATALLAESLDQIALMVSEGYAIDERAVVSKLDQAMKDIASIRAVITQRKR
jgi:hypothetical protein